MPVNLSATSSYGTATYAPPPPTNPTYYTSNSNGYQPLPPSSVSAPPSTSVVVHQEPKKKGRKCTICCLQLFTLLSLAIAITALVLGTYGQVSLTQFKSQFSVQKSFPIQTKSSDGYTNNDLKTVSMVNFGRVTLGYGYNVGSPAYLSTTSISQNTKIANLTDTNFVAARVSGGRIYVTSLSASGSTLNYGSEYSFQPSVMADQVLAVVNVRGDDSTETYGQRKFLIIFSDQGGNFYSLSATYYSSSAYTFSLDTKEVLIYTNTYSGYKNLNVSAVALSDNTVAMALTFDGRSVVVACYPNSATPVCLKSDTVKSCRANTLVAYNATSFLALCGTSMSFFSINFLDAQLEESYSTTVTSDTVIYGPVMTKTAINGSYVIYYVDNNNNLKAMVTKTTFSFSSWSKNIYVGDGGVTTVENQIDLSKPVSMISAGPFGLYFSYAKNTKNMIKACILSYSSTGSQVIISAEANGKELPSASNVYPIGVFVSDSYNTYMKHPAIIFIIPGSSLSYSYVEIIGGFYPLGVTSSRQFYYYSSSYSTTVTLRGIASSNNLYPGSRYYTSQNGDISMNTRDSFGSKNVIVGIALSETELLVSDMSDY